MNKLYHLRTVPKLGSTMRTCYPFFKTKKAAINRAKVLAQELETIIEVYTPTGRMVLMVCPVDDIINQRRK